MCSRAHQTQDAPYRETVLEPIGKLCSYWPEVNAAITKRNNKVRQPPPGLESVLARPIADTFYPST